MRTETRLVIVPTLVRNASNELIQTLHASDFRIFDNGIEQSVSLEDSDRQPLAVVIVMQIGGAAARQFPAYAGLGTMIESIVGGSPHRVALVTFDSEPDSVWDFRPEIDTLHHDLAHPDQGDSGAAIFDAVSYGIGLLRQQPAGYRRILLLLSQPQDNGSKASAADVVRSLGENNVTILSVTFSPEKTWLKDQFTKPRHENPPYRLTPSEPPLLHTFDLSTPLKIAIDALRSNAASEIAAQSGGESVEFGDRQELERQLSQFSNHLAARYMLSFRPRPGEPGFHTLRVAVPGQPGLDISARRGYWSSSSAVK